MAIVFSDSFAGSAGSLAGHSPEIAFSGLTWASASMVLSGTGFTGPSDNSDRSVYGEATYGNTNTSRGLGNAFDLTFTLKTGPDVSGGLENTGFLVRIYANGRAYDFVFGGTESGWAAFIASAGGNSVFIYPAVAPNTEYACTATVNTAGASFTLGGVTVTLAYGASSPGTGLSGLYLLVGGTCLVGELTITPPPTPTARFTAPAVMGALSLRAVNRLPLRVLAPSPMGSLSALVWHNFTGILGDATSVYAMDLITPGGAVRVPVSSWQATLQTTDANYVQCVVPACGVWLDALNAASEFVIYRRAVLHSGQAFEYEMARVPAEQMTFDRGPERYTCTLSGYSPGFSEDLAPPAAYDRALVGVRSVSSGPGGMRVRCDVDWLLRPGHRAFVDGVPLVVAYINYYAPTGFDAYMDVGSRV